MHFLSLWLFVCVCVCLSVLFDKSKIWYDAKVLIYMFNCLFHVTCVHTLTTIASVMNFGVCTQRTKTDLDTNIFMA